MENKCCLQCGSPVKGRRDKKFCDDHCRNNYNNQLHLNTTMMMRQVHQILRKNRRILEEAAIYHREGERIPLEPLLEEGFLPGYHTKVSHDAEGKPQYFCYEIGFRMIDNHIVLLQNPLSKAA